MKSFRRPAGATKFASRAFSVLCLLSALLPAQAQDTKIKVDPDAAKNYVALANGVSPVVEPRSSMRCAPPTNVMRAWWRLTLSWSIAKSLFDDRPISNVARPSAARRPSSGP